MSLWILRHHRLTTWRLGRQLFNFDGALSPSARGLLVGECPGPNTDSRTPMFPHPPGSAAGRLLRSGGMTSRDYLDRLERVNQCEKVWSDFEARRRYELIVKWLLSSENRVDNRPLRVLLLGRNVQRIWDVGGSGFGYQRWGELQIAWVPHPSGLTRTYNSVEARQRLGRYVRWCAGLSTEKFMSST